MKLLSDILKPLKPLIVAVQGDAAIIISGITADSRQVAKGMLFVAVRGTAADGGAFIIDAIEKQAAAVVCEVLPQQVTLGVTYILVTDTRLALSAVAAAFYDRQPKYVTAVTGTDGKTSTADFFRQLCALAGHKAASIGTLGVLGSGREYPALNTTPDPILLHRALSELAEDGIRHVCVEASSHGLVQHRLENVHVRAASFTNLTRDHLDYHKTVEQYFAAKLRLFSDVLQPGGLAVVNADDAQAPAVLEACRARGCRAITYGYKGDALQLLSVTPTEQGLDVHAVLYGTEKRFVVPMVGTFQAMNLLAAIGMAEACDVDVQQLLAVIPQLKPIPGRLELAGIHREGAPVFVDYAHTPAALANVLHVVRAHVPGRLWVVFGCGGDRDKGKRPQMGKAAVEKADVVVIADDNPRSEDPETIRTEIVTGLSAYDLKRVKNIGDRREAIAFAVKSLHKGDGLVIAGKGHEKTQIIGSKTLPFDDAQTAREMIDNM